MTSFMKKYYTILPNDIQEKINKIVYNNYLDSYNKTLDNYGHYIIDLPINLKYFNNNDPFNINYPHYFGNNFRLKYSEEIGKGLCQIGDIVSDSIKYDRLYIIIGYNYVDNIDYIDNIITTDKNIVSWPINNFYTMRHLLLVRLNMNINEWINDRLPYYKIDDNKIDDNKIDDNKIDDNKIDDNYILDTVKLNGERLFTCYWDYNYIIIYSHISYNSLKLVNNIRKYYNLSIITERSYPFK